MSEECDLPFDRNKNCSQTLEDNFEPYSSAFRLVCMTVTLILLAWILPLSFYYLRHIRPSEEKGPVKKAKSLLALASPTILVLSFFYGCLGFFWRHESSSTEGKLSFMIFISTITLSLNTEVVLHITLSESIPFYSKKDGVVTLFYGLLYWQVLALICSNATIFFMNLSFTELFLLSCFVCGVPHLVLVPYNFMVCSDFQRLLNETIESEKRNGNNVTELSRLHRHVSDSLHLFVTGTIFVILDALAFVPFFQESVPFIMVQTILKLSFCICGCFRMNKYFFKFIEREMSTKMYKEVTCILRKTYPFKPAKVNGTPQSVEI